MVVPDAHSACNAFCLWSQYIATLQGEKMAAGTKRGKTITRRSKANWKLIRPGQKNHLSASLLKVLYVGGERIAIFRLNEKL
jgi:hypothetical protein